MNVGFVGLGAMGVGMAGNLSAKGFLKTIWNRTPQKSLALAAQLNCHVAASLRDLARSCEVVVSCVSADSDVLAVVDELACALRPESVLIDCSTISSGTAVIAAQRLAQIECEFLDAPVSGGVEGARDGTLAVMVGGKEDVFTRCLPVLQSLGRTVTHFGATGAGQAAKATNQIMCAGVIQAVAEAMAFAKAQGLPLDKLIQTLSQGAGSSWYFVHRAPNILRDSYPPGFRVRLHEKDLRICREMAARYGVQLPLVEMTLLHYRKLIEQGHGDEDISTLFHLKDALFKDAEQHRELRDAGP